MMQASERKRQANRLNSKLGGEAVRLKFELEYYANPKICPTCNGVVPREKRQNRFCSRSCSATFNNTGVRRHGQPNRECAVCGNATANSQSVYCSKKCAGDARRFRTPEENRARRNEASARYRASLRNQTPSDADRPAIKKFYEECPTGYEVDHVIPISKGGMHTLENLQYLTITENRRKGNRFGPEA